MRIPDQPLTNKGLSRSTGESVIKFEVLPIAVGQVFALRFLRSSGPHRHGVWLGVEGQIEVDGSLAPQVRLWSDSAAGEIRLRIAQTDDGLLRLYNIWDRRDNTGTRSQGDYAGMLKETHGARTVYRCSAYGEAPTFDHLVFELEVLADR